MKNRECSNEHCVCHTPAAPPKFDSLSFIMDYESGALNEEQIIKGFQHLIDAGLVWQLQGSYGRMAMQLINAGLCHYRDNDKNEAGAVAV